MGMSISSAASPATSSTSMWQQKRQDFSQLSSALQSGNLQGAQQAFAALTGNSSSAGSTAGATSAATPNSPLAALSAALSSGNLQAAQQAFAALPANATQQTGAVSGHHHHHHHSQAASATTTAPATVPLATSGPVGTQVNTTA